MSLDTMRDHEQRLKALERGAGAGRPISAENWRAIVGPDIVLYAPFDGDANDHSGFGDVAEFLGNDYCVAAKNAADPNAAISEVVNAYNAGSDPNRVNFGVTGGADIVVPADEQWIIGSDIGFPYASSFTPLNATGGFGAFVITGPYSGHFTSGVAAKLLVGGWAVLARDSFGRNNRAYRFWGGDSGAAAEIRWPHQTRHDIVGDFSIAMTCQPSEFPGSFAILAHKEGFATWNLILEAGGGPTFGQVSWSTWVGTNRQPLFGADGGKFFSEGDQLRIVCTRFTTGLQQIFINGELFHQATFTGGNVDMGTEPVGVGATYENVGMLGTIDEFYLIKRGLSYFEAIAYGLIK